ncbi:MAG: hypothetical protein F6K14_10250 [Symploca sp. SIO2C1]|nr:hypothetical protein [Symploca sp. SIO2C1]
MALISSSVKYLHFGGNKAGGRRQEAGGKKEGCKVEGHYNCLSELDITHPPALKHGGFRVSKLLVVGCL